MTPDRWSEVKSLFEKALQQPDSERGRFVEQLCADERLRNAVSRLLACHEISGSWLKGPVFDARRAFLQESQGSTLLSGEVFADRFQLGELIGKGGMGEVYAAFDLDLGEPVAIKVLRSDIAGVGKAMERFRREIQLSRRISHPNVCRVHDLYRHIGEREEELVFLSMELIPGETLTERIRRCGSLTTLEAEPIARQIAAALQAAHERGVIHRDLKPSNVILDDSSGDRLRAVVTDFGLAQEALASEAQDQLTATGAVIGTPAYMSPERLRGAKAEPASDIYALGLVLFEMVTGAHPYQLETTSPEAQAFPIRVPSPRNQLPQLEVSWEDAIVKCLQPDPSQRFAEPKEVAEAISRPIGRLEKVFPNLGAGRSTAAGRRRLGKALKSSTAFFLILVAAVAGYFRLYEWKPPPAGFRMLFADLVIEAPNDDNRWDGLAVILKRQLSQSRQFQLADSYGIESTMRRVQEHRGSNGQAPSVEEWEETALLEGIPFLLFARLSQPGRGFALNLELLQLGERVGAPLRSWPESFHAADQQEMLDAVRKAANWTRRILGESTADIAQADRRPQDVTTGSLTAARLFHTAEGLIQGEDRRKADAIGLLEKALEVDPKFYLAEMRLADALFSVGRRWEGLAHYKKALAGIGTGRMTPCEEHRIEGLYASDTRDYRAAATAFGQWADDCPEDGQPYFYRARPRKILGETRGALSDLKEVLKRKPERLHDFALVHLAVYSLIEDLDQAEGYIDQLEQRGLTENAKSVKGKLNFLRGDYDEALRLFEGLEESSDDAVQRLSYTLQACLHAEFGRYQEAISVLEEGIEDDKKNRRDNPAERANRLLFIAYLHLKAGRLPEAVQKAQQAASLDRDPFRLARAASILARARALTEAEKLYKEIDTFGQERIGRIVAHTVEGEFKLARGQVAEAVGDFEALYGLHPGPLQAEALARAYQAAGRRDEKKRILGPLADNPGTIWHGPASYWPGFWTDILLLHSSADRESTSPETDLGQRGGLQRYLSFREHGDAFLPDTTAAREMLQLPLNNR